jgi:hypothetical protein
MKRNEIPFSDGGISVNFQPLIQMLEAEALRYKQEWENFKMQKKIELNIAGALGTNSPGTEYSIILSLVER